MRISRDSTIEREARRLQKAGWSVVRGSKHVKLRSPANQMITAPGSPSDHRAAQNFIHQVRRMERAAAQA